MVVEVCEIIPKLSINIPRRLQAHAEHATNRFKLILNIKNITITIILILKDIFSY